MLKYWREIFLVLVLLITGGAVRKLFFNRALHSINLSSKRSEPAFLTEASLKANAPHVQAPATQALPTHLQEPEFKIKKYVGANTLLQFAKPAVPPEAILKSVGMASYLDGQVIKLDTNILAQNFEHQQIFSFPVLGGGSFKIKPENRSTNDDGTEIYSGKVIAPDSTSREVGFFYMVRSGEMIKGALQSDKEAFVLQYGRHGQYMLRLNPENNIAID